MKSEKIYNTNVAELVQLNHLFIELTEKNCNQKCRQCFINFPSMRQVKDFISVDKIKEALSETKDENLTFIYLTGAEPMTHPDFNTILRLCLKRTNVCICTNGSFINEKKSRFLKKVEDESEYKIVFMLPVSHYDEVKSDDVRSRGAFRQVMHAMKSLFHYNFDCILCVSNFYNENPEVIKSELKTVFEKYEIEADEKFIKINQYFRQGSNREFPTWKNDNFDCKTGRILTSKGVYSCPFLANDYRGRMGANFKDFSKKVHLETSFCQTCGQNEGKMFALEI